MPGEGGGHPDRLQVVFGDDHLHLVEAQVRTCHRLPPVRLQLARPFLLEGARSDLAGLDPKPRASGRRPEPEAERQPSRLDTDLAATVALVGDLRALVADTAHEALIVADSSSPLAATSVTCH